MEKEEGGGLSARRRKSLESELQVSQSEKKITRRWTSGQLEIELNNKVPRVICLQSTQNNRSDRSMEVKLPALLRKFKKKSYWTMNNPTNGQEWSCSESN